jgi:desulfoferrodoxin (superoxide reductase-like protein)
MLSPVIDEQVEEKAVAVYEYCNLHGSWKTEL